MIVGANNLPAPNLHVESLEPSMQRVNSIVHGELVQIAVQNELAILDPISDPTHYTPVVRPRFAEELRVVLFITSEANSHFLAHSFRVRCSE
jgi:hypothetical protein